jgi:hypothetical protein
VPGSGHVDVSHQVRERAGALGPELFVLLWIPDWGGNLSAGG